MPNTSDVRSKLTKSILTIGLLSITASMTACSFVELKPEAEHVILSNDNATCKRIGQTTVSVLHEFVAIDRNVDTISEELQTLARNAAAKMGGNAIWPESEITEGEQDFGVYRCAAN